MKANEYLDEAKKALGLTSDYAFCKKENLSRGAISEIRQGKRGLTDEYLIFRIADILKINPSDIIVDLKSQSEKNEVKLSYWQKLKRGLTRLRIMYIM